MNSEKMAAPARNELSSSLENGLQKENISKGRCLLCGLCSIAIIFTGWFQHGGFWWWLSDALVRVVEWIQFIIIWCQPVLCTVRSRKRKPLSTSFCLSETPAWIRIWQSLAGSRQAESMAGQTCLRRICSWHWYPVWRMWINIVRYWQSGKSILLHKRVNEIRSKSLWDLDTVSCSINNFLFDQKCSVCHV